MSCVPITAANGGLLQSPAPCCWQEEKEGSEWEKQSRDKLQSHQRGYKAHTMPLPHHS